MDVLGRLDNNDAEGDIEDEEDGEEDDSGLDSNMQNLMVDQDD